ncbi:hypothetical protein BH11BAC7_BH11BAC7_21040 [soil metagenome]
MVQDHSEKTAAKEHNGHAQQIKGDARGVSYPAPNQNRFDNRLETGTAAPLQFSGVIQMVKKTFKSNLFKKGEAEPFKEWVVQQGYKITGPKDGVFEISHKDPFLPATLIFTFREEFEKKNVKPEPVIATVGQGLYAVATDATKINGLQTYGAAPCVAVALSNPVNGIYAVAHIDPEANIKQTIFDIYDKMVDTLNAWKNCGFAEANAFISNNTQILLSSSLPGNENVGVVQDAIGRCFRQRIVISETGNASIVGGRLGDDTAKNMADFITSYRNHKENLKAVPKPMLLEMQMTATETLKMLTKQKGDQTYANINKAEIETALKAITDAIE